MSQYEKEEQYFGDQLNKCSPDVKYLADLFSTTVHELSNNEEISTSDYIYLIRQLTFSIERLTWLGDFGIENPDDLEFSNSIDNWFERNERIVLAIKLDAFREIQSKQIAVGETSSRIIGIEEQSKLLHEHLQDLINEVPALWEKLTYLAHLIHSFLKSEEVVQSSKGDLGYL